MHAIPAAITMDSASATLADLRKVIDGGESALSADALAHSDSSAVAVLLAAIRHGRLSGKVVTIAGLPASLQSLAKLYGVEGLLTGNAPAPSGAVPASRAA